MVDCWLGRGCHSGHRSPTGGAVRSERGPLDARGDHPGAEIDRGAVLEADELRRRAEHVRVPRCHQHRHPGRAETGRRSRAETSGPGWAYSAEYQEVEVTSPGAVLSDLSITGNLNIEAANVTIDNVAVINSGNGWGIGLMHSVDATIEHSEVYSPPGADRLQVAIKDVYGDATGTNIRTTNIWDADTGIQLSQGHVANNYIHNMEADPGDHVNGIVSDAGVAAGLIIAHNTVFTPTGQTDAIGLFEDFGPQMDVTITHNLLSGGGYTIYGGANSGGATPSNIVITGNRFATTYFPDGGFYGPAAAVDTGVNGDVWSGNIWDSTGSTVCP